MNTPAHLLIGAAVGGRKEIPKSTGWAMVGSLVPDLSLYVMSIFSMWIMGISAETVFRDLYYSDAWQQVFAVDNSFVIWGAVLALCIWRKWRLGIAFCIGGLLHLALDFPFHTHDARMHFWPISSWVFESPVSYWDRSAYANIVGPIELVFSMAAAWVLWKRGLGVGFLILIVFLLGLELTSSGIWQFIF